MKDCLLGIDLGTGGCKITLIDRQGTILGESFTEYKTQYSNPGWAEQDPQDWVRSFILTLRSVFSRARRSPSNVSAIGIDGSTHNAVLIGKRNRVLRPCIMWMDQRSIGQSRALEKRIGKEIFRITFNKVNPTWTLPQLLWIRENEPRVIKEVERIFFVKDYLRHRLSGTWETDYIDAQGSMLFDGKRRKWSEELIGEVGLSPNVFPGVIKPTEICGRVTQEAAAETGLREGTPIIVGTSDTAAEDYGAGAVNPGQGIVKMATAGNVCLMSEKPRPTPLGFNYPHVVEGMWYIVAGTNSCAIANRWYRDTLCQWEIEEARKTRKPVFRLLDEIASKAPAGSEGLFFHPYLMGERSPYFDPFLRAGFVGVTARHRKEHFSRAVLEGVAYSLLDAQRVIPGLGQGPKDIRLIGGGARSPLWRKILTDVMGKPILVPASGDASFGSALLAGVGIGLFSGLNDAVRRCVHYVDKLVPDSRSHASYQKYFSIYRKIHDRLAPVHRMIDETFVKEETSKGNNVRNKRGRSPVGQARRKEAAENGGDDREGTLRF